MKKAEVSKRKEKKIKKKKKAMCPSVQGVGTFYVTRSNIGQLFLYNFKAGVSNIGG
jgi:hypothetical protein